MIAYKIFDNETETYWENPKNAFGIWFNSAAAKAEVTWMLKQFYTADKEEMKRLNKTYKQQTRFQIHEFEITLKRIVK